MQMDGLDGKVMNDARQRYKQAKVTSPFLPSY